MPPIRTITYRNIVDFHTSSTIDKIYNARNNVDAESSPETAAMVADWSSMSRRRGARTNETTNAAPREFSVDTMTDEEMERVIIRLQSSESSESNSKESGAQNLFKTYRHHQFVHRWGLFTDKEGVDEPWFLPNPPVLSEDEPGYLCDMCRHIDFTTLFTQPGLPGNQNPGPCTILLFGLRKLMTDSKCEFCTMVRQRILKYGLLASLSEEEIDDGTFQLNVLDEGPDRALRLEVELADVHLVQGHPRFVLQVLDGESKFPLRGLPVSQGDADISKLKQWIWQCEKTHKSPTQNHETYVNHKPPTLRLIDTQDYCVRLVKAPYEYACLSYVWGGGSQVQYTSKTMVILDQEGGLRDASMDLPQTIKDAIDVARSLGLRYIWIDALCIIQDDQEDKEHIISNMHTIYGNATVTIVASTNTDPTQGIPGVSQPRSEAQITGNVQGMTLAVAFQDVRKRYSDIDESKWNSRAWTFQERLLSPRSVYFTNSQMCFECPHGTIFEDTVPVQDPNYKPLPLNDQTQFSSRLYDLWTRVWADPSQVKYPNKAFVLGETIMILTAEDRSAPDECSQEPAPYYEFSDSANEGALYKDLSGNGTLWDQYRRSVNSYTMREMSSQTDAVNAFLGVTDLIRQGTNTTFWYGMPEFAFDESLLWQPKEPLKRRMLDGKPLFPSWTWAAWEGHVSYRGRGWYNSVKFPPASLLRWFEKLGPRAYLEQWKTAEARTEEEVDTMVRQLEGMRTVIQEHVGEDLMHWDYQELGWEVKLDDKTNQHTYTHESYPGIEFGYPICLPGQEIKNRADNEGSLYIKGRQVAAQFCDMKNVEPVAAPCQDAFIQIGFNDERRSSNRRRPWQHILYHQGYRAGFLSLNVPLEALNPENDRYILMAVSRDTLPQIESPELNWGFIRNMDPQQAQRMIFLEEVDADQVTERRPNEDAVADTEPQNENGDPYWDLGRFGHVAIFDVYNVLLIKEEQGFWERIGVGKINFVAFNAASPRAVDIRLR